MNWYIAQVVGGEVRQVIFQSRVSSALARAHSKGYNKHLGGQLIAVRARDELEAFALAQRELKQEKGAD